MIYQTTLYLNFVFILLYYIKKYFYIYLYIKYNIKLKQNLLVLIIYYKTKLAFFRKL